MTDLRKAAEQALEALHNIDQSNNDDAIEALRQALAQTVDAVPGFTAAEPRQSLSRMKPGDRFILVRTSEIYQIKQDGSQWNETRQRPARLHKNSQVRLIVTHPKCDDACMNICTEGFTKPPTCKTSVDAVNISQEHVDETAKHEHEPVGYIDGMHGGYMVFTPLNPSAVYLNGTALYLAPPKREWVGLTDEELEDLEFASVDREYGHLDIRVLSRAIEAKLREKNL